MDQETMNAGAARSPGMDAEGEREARGQQQREPEGRPEGRREPEGQPDPAADPGSPPALADADVAARPDEEGEQEALQVDVEQLIAAAAKKDEYLALAQRTQADFENYRKRVAKEAASAQRRGVSKLAKELLPALDSLDRAIDAAEEGDPLLEGVRLVRNELHGALVRVGIESFSPEGERFDPAQHEAMAQRQVDGAQSGAVVEVYQAGYRMGDEVIRPARVLVAA